MSASALMDWMTSNLFLAVAGGLLGAVAVGALKAAQNLMGVTHVFLLGLENVVPSRATARLHEGGVRSMTGYLKRVTLHGAAATCAVAALAALAPDFWLGLVFGEEFVGYGGLLRWYAVIYVVTFLMVPLQAGLRAIERTQLIFRAYFAGTLLSLIAVFPLVSWFGLTGAVAGILAVRLMQTLILEQGFGGAVKGFNAHVG